MKQSNLAAQNNVPAFAPGPHLNQTLADCGKFAVDTVQAALNTGHSAIEYIHAFIQPINSFVDGCQTTVIL
jgi:hypothetical protein